MMRRLLLAVVLVLAAVRPALAQRTLVIQQFDAVIDVAVDGTISVQETILPRFTGSWNGIYRTIPVEYATPQGLNYELRLDVDSVTDDAGATLRYESSRERHYRKLKIWVPGAADAVRTVVLRYHVQNALRFFEEHDELYWNVTGDEWDVPIERASAVVHLPGGVAGVRGVAFRGAYGSTERSQVATFGTTVSVVTEHLAFHEGLTVAVGWNPGVVHRPTTAERTVGVVQSNLPLTLPLLVFGGMFWLWRSRGRDPALAPIVTRYEPPEDMTPAELGTLVDGSPDMRDITATVVDLAVRGYLHITETKNERFFGLFSNKDYQFTLKKKQSEWTTLKTHEHDLLDAMFGTGDMVNLSDLRNKFYKQLPQLKNGLYDHLVKGGFYTARPDRVRAIYIGAGVVLGGVFAFAGAHLMQTLGMQPFAAIAAGVLTVIIVIAFGWVMPSRTVKGTRELEKILGFQEFLTRVEGDKLERMTRTPEMFEKFLAYAMALGVESHWAKAFEGIYRQPPQWYSGPAGVGIFHPGSFTSDLTRMSTAAASVMASSPRGSGGSGFSGGSSGGGFGGGGGGGF
jgi:uncharacterized membrane protein